MIEIKVFVDKDTSVIIPNDKIVSVVFEQKWDKSGPTTTLVADLWSKDLIKIPDHTKDYIVVLVRYKAVGESQYNDLFQGLLKTKHSVYDGADRLNLVCQDFSLALARNMTGLAKNNINPLKAFRRLINEYHKRFATIAKTANIVLASEMDSELEGVLTDFFSLHQVPNVQITKIDQPKDDWGWITSVLQRAGQYVFYDKGTAKIRSRPQGKKLEVSRSNLKLRQIDFYKHRDFQAVSELDKGKKKKIKSRKGSKNKKQEDLLVSRNFPGLDQFIKAKGKETQKIMLDIDLTPTITMDTPVYLIGFSSEIDGYWEPIGVKHELIKASSYEMTQVEMVRTRDDLDYIKPKKIVKKNKFVPRSNSVHEVAVETITNRQ